MKTRSESPQVHMVVENACARVLLNRPEVGNALNPSMVEELERAVDGANEAGVRLIVFQGAGKHMCTGFDLSDLDTCSDGDLLLRFVRIEYLLQKIYCGPVMTAAVGSGRVYGAGADLFAACDWRIGFPSASFAFPGSGFGLILGTRRLAARIGNDVALAAAAIPTTVAALRRRPSHETMTLISRRRSTPQAVLDLKKRLRPIGRRSSRRDRRGRCWRSAVRRRNQLRLQLAARPEKR